MERLKLEQIARKPIFTSVQPYKDSLPKKATQLVSQMCNRTTKHCPIFAFSVTSWCAHMLKILTSQFMWLLRAVDMLLFCRALKWRHWKRIPRIFVIHMLSLAIWLWFPQTVVRCNAAYVVLMSIVKVTYGSLLFPQRFHTDTTRRRKCGYTINELQRVRWIYKDFL